MRIGVIGKGNVGSCLGTLWSRLGHEVLFGVRDPESEDVKQLLGQCRSDAGAVTPKEVFQRSDVILLAVRCEDVSSVLEGVGEMNGTILIDCMTPVERGTGRILLDWNRPAAEQLEALTPGARVVKCFDTAGVGVMKNPIFGPERATMFVCGDHVEAKDCVMSLAEELGFECLDAGPLSAARYLEALSAFWIHLAFKQKLGIDFAFRVVRR